MNTSIKRAPVSSSSPPTISSQSRLAQGYRTASPVSHELGCCAVTSPAGWVEVFTIGSDGAVTMFQRSAASRSGWVQTDLGGDMNKIRVVVDPTNNCYVIFGRSNDGYLHWKRATPTGWGEWEDFVISEYVTAVDFDLMFAGDMLVMPLSTGSPQIGYFVPIGANGSVLPWNALDFDNAATIVKALPSPDGETFTMAAANATTVFLWPAGNRVPGAELTLPSPAGLTITSMGASLRADGSIDIVVLASPSPGQSAGVLLSSRWTPSAGFTRWHHAMSDSQDSHELPCTDLWTVASRAGALDSFMLDASTHALTHSSCAAEGKKWTFPLPLGGKYAQLSAATNGEGDPEVFAIGLDGSLDHWKRNPETGDWEVSSIEVSTPDKIEAITWYEVEVTALDDSGAPCANAAVSLTTSGLATIMVGGQSRYVDAQTPVTTTLGPLGRLTIHLPTKTLSVPELRVSVTDEGANATATVQPNAAVQDKLYEASGVDLAARFDLHHDVANALANGLRQIASLGKPLPPSPGTARVALAGGAQPWWSLRFTESGVVYEQLDPSEGRRRRDALLARPQLGDFLGIAGAWGDLWAAVESGVATINEVIVTPVLDKAGELVKSMQATFDVAVQGAAQALQAGFAGVVDTVERIFDLVEGVCAKVQVFFADLARWLGFVYDWPDIVRTSQAFAYTIRQMMGFIGGCAAGAQRLFDARFGAFQGQIHTLFQQAQQTILANRTFGGFAESAPPMPALDGATANNIIFDAIMRHTAGGAPNGSSAPRAKRMMGFSDSLAPLQQRLDGLAAQLQNAPAFAQAQTYFQNLGGSPEEVLRQSLAGLLSVAEGIAQAAFSGVQAVIDELLGLIPPLMTTIQALLDEPSNSPFVTALYRSITDSPSAPPPSTLELAALLIAVPAVTLYRSTFGKPCFPDADSLIAFKGSFDAQMMLDAAGFGARPLAAAPRLLDAAGSQWTGLVPKSVADVLAFLSSTAMFFYGAMTAISDSYPPGASPELPFPIYAYVCELGVQALTCPWWCDSAPPDCVSVAGKTASLWLYGLGGLVLDGYFVGAFGKMPENAEDKGVVCTVAYGAIQLSLGISSCFDANDPNKNASPAVALNNILPAVPQTLKFLRHSAVVADTGGTSLAVQSVIDGVFYTAAAVTNALAAPKSN